MLIQCWNRASLTSAGVSPRAFFDVNSASTRLIATCDSLVTTVPRIMMIPSSTSAAVR